MSRMSWLRPFAALTQATRPRRRQGPRSRPARTPPRVEELEDRLLLSSINSLVGAFIYGTSDNGQFILYTDNNNFKAGSPPPTVPLKLRDTANPSNDVTINPNAINPAALSGTQLSVNPALKPVISPDGGAVAYVVNPGSGGNKFTRFTSSAAQPGPRRRSATPTPRPGPWPTPTRTARSSTGTAAPSPSAAPPRTW